MRLIGVFTLLVGLLAWTGCDSAGVTPPGESESGGRMRVLLTDAPGDLAEANVTVQRVEVVPNDGAPIVLMEKDTTLNLLELQSGVTATLADTSLPAGTYSQLRFIVADTASVRLDSGVELDLKVPSGAQTGIKINMPPVEMSEASTVEITLDFSVEDSFVRAGRSGKFIFKPVVKTKEMEVDGEELDFVEMSGAITALGEDTVEVDSVAFAVTEDTEIEGENEGATLASLVTGLFVEVEATPQEDGTLIAHEIEVQDDEEQERKVEATVEAVTDSSVTALGVSFDVDENTELDGFSAMSELQVGDPVEITYAIENDTYVALKIDKEGEHEEEHEEEED